MITHERFLAVLALVGYLVTLALCHQAGLRWQNRSRRERRMLRAYWQRRRLGGVFDYEREEDWR